jgi:transposase
MSTLPPLGLADGERAELQRRVRAHTTPQRDVTRARMILLAADALPNRQIARLVGMHPDAVGRWRRRFQHQRVAGLADRPRSGRPLVYGHDDRLRIVATVTREPPNPASHWSHTQLADTLADIGISASQIGRILADLDIKPHRVRGWITRREVPGFGSGPPTSAGCTSMRPTARWCWQPMRRPGSGRAAAPGHRRCQHPAGPLARNTSTSAMAPRTCSSRWMFTAAGSIRPPTWTATPQRTSSRS